MGVPRDPVRRQRPSVPRLPRPHRLVLIRSLLMVSLVLSLLRHPLPLLLSLNQLMPLYVEIELARLGSRAPAP